MSNETKNEPKSLAEMTKEELRNDFLRAVSLNQKVTAVAHFDEVQRRDEVAERKLQLSEAANTLLLEQCEGSPAFCSIVAKWADMKLEQRALAAERKLQEQTEAVRKLLEAWDGTESLFSPIERLKALQPTPEGHS